MDSFFHSLHISTLGAWLSVAGFGAVGVSVAPWQAPSPPAPPPSETVVDLTPADFLIDAGDPGDQADASAAEPAAPSPEMDQEILPAPAELSPLDETEPLPEIPEIPDLPPPPAIKPAATPTPPKTSGSTRSSTASSGSSSSNNPRSSGSANGGRPGGSNGGASAASRLAAGRMPAPQYPSSSKRKGETGSVTVSFTIGTNGKVISATVSGPSPYPALNEAAVRAVRRWKFPPGGVLKTQRRLDFVLRN